MCSVIARQYTNAADLQLLYTKSFARGLSGSLPLGREEIRSRVQVAVIFSFDRSWGVVRRSTCLIVESKRKRISSNIAAVSLLVPSSSAEVANVIPVEDNSGVITFAGCGGRIATLCGKESSRS